MSITPLIYIDNSILRDLQDRPKYWNDLRNILVPIYGQSFRACSSYYLFFEYYGASGDGAKAIGLKIPSINLCKFNEINSQEKASAKINELGKQLDVWFEQARLDFEQQLFFNKQRFQNLLQERKRHESLFEGSQELRDDLFRDILNLFYSDYSSFVANASGYLAWDWFCNIQPPGITIELLRQAQLGIWNQLREKGFLFPSGKIIDDLSEKYLGINLKKNSYFRGNFRDMVDSEAITSVVMEKTVFLTYDKEININQRVSLVLQSITQVEKALNITIPRDFGKIYCLTRPIPNRITKIDIDKIIEPVEPILL